MKGFQVTAGGGRTGRDGIVVDAEHISRGDVEDVDGDFGDDGMDVLEELIELHHLRRVRLQHPGQELADQVLQPAREAAGRRQTGEPMNRSID